MRNANAPTRILRITLICMLIEAANLQAQLRTAGSTEDQGQIMSIGILNLRDESDSGRVDLSVKLTQQLRQRLFTIYPDLLPKMLGQEPGADLIRGMTIEELKNLGHQFGVLYVLRGGLMPAEVETEGGLTEIKVHLYAEIISIETGEMRSLRGEGSGSQERISSSSLGWEQVNFAISDFRESALGQALSTGIDQLVGAIHEELIALSNSARQRPSEELPSEEVAKDETMIEELPADGTLPEEAQLDEALEELQNEGAVQEAAEEQELLQLIADAEAILAAGSTADPEMIDRLSSVLSDLRNALAVKADQLQRGEVTEETDQAVEQMKEKLQETITEINSGGVEAATADLDPAQSEQTHETLTQANTFASEVAALIQKIQELQAMLRGANEEASLTEDDQEYPEASEEVMEEVSGVILEDGQPVEGAEVIDTESGASATTGSDGGYVLSPIPAGTVSNLQVNVKGKQIATGRTPVVGGANNVADFSLSSAAGSKTRIGVISSTAVTRDVKKAGGTLKGTVQDANNHPIPRAIVQLLGVGVVRTNSVGEYAFMNVPLGNYQIKIQQPGFQPQITQVGIKPGETSRTVIRLGAMAPVTNQLVRPQLLVKVAGAVLQGQVLDGQKKPLPGVKISAARRSIAVSSLTGRAGRYEMRNLSSGVYRVVAIKPGFRTAVAEVNLTAGKTEKRDFIMRQTSPLVDQMRTTTQVRRGILYGQVRGKNNDSLAGALIVARPIGSKQVSFQIRTKADGKFVMNMPEGQYRLEIRRARYQTLSRTITLRAGKSIQENFLLGRIESPEQLATANTQIRKAVAGSAASEKSRTKATRSAASVPARNGRVQGRIVDSRSKQAVADASVALAGAGNTKTDRSGVFTLDNVRPGKYRLSVTQKGYLSTTKTITVEEGRTIKVNLNLTPSAKVLKAPTVIPKK
jgi:hypothetical protein